MIETYGPHNAPNVLYTARGRLTRYAFACGYIEQHRTQQNRFDPELTTTTLDAAPGLICYHIKSSGPNVTPQPTGSHRYHWDTARTLTGARKIYAAHIRQYHKGAN